MGQGQRRKLLNLPPQHLKSSIQPVLQKTPGQLVPPGMQTIAFIAPAVDCTIEKIVGEMALYWHKQGIFSLVVNEKKCREALQYTPSKVIFFRSTTKGGVSNQEVSELGSFILYLQNLGIRVTYYLDDFLVGVNKGAPLFLMSKVDEIIVATDSLKDFILHYAAGKPITVIKTHIDLPTIDSLPKSDLVPDGYFNILFTSEGRIGALMLYRIVEYMNQYPEKYKDINIISVTAGVAQVRSIINKFRSIKKTYYERLPLGEFYQMIKSVDLILSPGEIGDLDYMVPREMQQNWLDSKSCVKYTLAGAASIPCIVSINMREYRQAVKQGETGFIAGPFEDWIKYIDILHKDRELSKKIGKEARRDMEENYHVAKRALEMLEAINGKPKTRTKDQRRIWLPLAVGGPRTFHDTLEKYLPIVSNGKMIVTETLDKSVETAIVVAFIGAEDVLRAKITYPNLRIISRVDGLPFNIEDGSINIDQIKLMTNIMSKADLIVWQSNFAKRMWEPHFQLKKESVIIPNGVDLEIFKLEGEKFPLDSSKFNALHVNYSTFRHKRIDLLEDTIKNNISNENLHFTLVGNYLDTSIINDMEKWMVYPNVTYLGPMSHNKEGRERLASIYRAADVLFFTSNHEGCPNTILEATGCGTSVLYNDEIDVVPELLGDKCIPIGNFDRMIKGELQPIEGLAKLAETYSAEQMARKYMEILC